MTLEVSAHARIKYSLHGHVLFNLQSTNLVIVGEIFPCKANTFSHNGWALTGNIPRFVYTRRPYILSPVSYKKRPCGTVTSLTSLSVQIFQSPESYVTRTPRYPTSYVGDSNSYTEKQFPKLYLALSASLPLQRILNPTATLHSSSNSIQRDSSSVLNGVGVQSVTKKMV